VTTPDNELPTSANEDGAALRRFVEDMARFTIGADQLADEEFRTAFAREQRLDPKEITEDDILAELGEERLYGETMAFWEMIRRARRLLARGSKL